MLSLPDFEEKQIVFIESDGAKKVSLQNDNLLLTEDGKTVYQVPCSKIFCIFIIGETSITSVFIRQAASYGILLVLLNRSFSVYALIGGETEGNYLLRQKQYGLQDTLDLARQLVQNKINNQIDLLNEKRSKTVTEKTAIEDLRKLQTNTQTALSLPELLGYEGNAAKIFFTNYFQKLGWRRRLPRTKYDVPNALLDIGYTLLFNFLDAHLRLYGFDTYKGFYHQLFYQRKSLVCDLEEPFRCIVEKALLKAYNLGQVNEKDFTTARRKYELKYQESRKYVKIFLEAIMENKKGIFTYVQQFYRAMMKGEDTLPTFFIK